jgi:hypothetical protein
MFSNNKTGGVSILGILFLALILILTLNYFHVNIKVSVDDTSTQNTDDNREVLTRIWTKYFSAPVGYIWDEFVIKTFWDPFMDMMTKIGNSDWTANQEDYPELLPTGNSQ